MGRKKKSNVIYTRVADQYSTCGTPGQTRYGVEVGKAYEGNKEIKWSKGK